MQSPDLYEGIGKEGIHVRKRDNGGHHHKPLSEGGLERKNDEYGELRSLVPCMVGEKAKIHDPKKNYVDQPRREYPETGMTVRHWQEKLTKWWRALKGRARTKPNTKLAKKKQRSSQTKILGGRGEKFARERKNACCGTNKCFWRAKARFTLGEGAPRKGVSAGVLGSVITFSQDRPVAETVSFSVQTGRGSTQVQGTTNIRVQQRIALPLSLAGLRKKKKFPWGGGGTLRKKSIGPCVNAA